jgi:small subunit ribosomal protein S8
MSLQDLSSDFVARINNSLISRKSSAEVIKNKMIVQICKKMTSLGYFESYEEKERTVLVNLIPSRIKNIRKISKPGRRVYTSYLELPKITGGKGDNIVTTSKGVMSGKDCIDNKTGGEVLFQVV